ncbi:MAG: OmpA family protein [Deltaproteobacteria bacterium]|nr:OmpA family protein [Deltaproteobacteria bacterium]MCB9785059.1 OmpA family protein [Deltaproteobacteria bacterium]
MRYLLLLTVGLAVTSCATSSKEVEEEENQAQQEPPPGLIEVVKYEEKTKQLMETTEKLQEAEGTLDEQRRRLQVICADYPEHAVCAEQTAARYALDSFCSEPEFKGHVDEIVKACHQGACKQVDQAELITRTQYMLLTQSLPHTLVTFPAAKSKLDATDRRQLQQFVEQVRADKGYLIIVGRASKDGPWRKNLEYALDRAEQTRQFLVDDLGIDKSRVGYITYGHDKMYLTDLDAERLSTKKLSMKQANRSALVFAYPCFEPDAAQAP